MKNYLIWFLTVEPSLAAEWKVLLDLYIKDQVIDTIQTTIGQFRFLAAWESCSRRSLTQDTQNLWKKTIY